MLLLYRCRDDRSGPVVHPFTFHYASTLSIVPLNIVREIRHLHSTMLLLYRYTAYLPERRIYHLHSTMLLLYPMRPNASKINDLFTFHYASTLSDGCPPEPSSA